MKNLILTILRASLALCVLPFALNAQNNALLFDGVDDHVTFATGPTFSGSGTMTFEAWIFPTTTMGFQTIASWTDGVNNEARFSIANGFLEVFESDGVQNGSVTGSITINANEWTHVAFVEDLGSIDFYVNGVQEIEGFNVASAGLSGMFSLGAYSGTFLPYGGLMDEVRVWSVAQNQTTIQDQMFQTLIGNEPNLIAYYQFNETTGTNLSDITSSGFDGTLTNFPAATDPNWQTPGAIPENALDFDGIDDYVNITSSLSYSSMGTQDNFTVELWANLEPVFTGSRRGSIFSINSFDGSTNRILLYINDGVDPALENRLGVVDAGINPDFDITGPIIADNTWHHIAYSRTGTVGTLYVDGILIGTHTADFTFDGTELWSLGQEFDGSAVMSDFIDGQLDDLRIWSVGRTEGEIQASMFSDLVGNEPNLEVYYPFNQGFAGGTNTLFTKLIDHTSNSFDGVLGAFALTGAGSNWVSSTEISVFEGTSNSDHEVVDGQAVPVNYGHTPIPVTNSREFTIENNGFDDLVVTDITTTGVFAVSSSTSFTVTAGSTANFTVDLLALSDGIANGTVTIQNNDPNELNFTFPVTGTKGTLLPKAYWTDETGTANDEIDRVDLSGANGQNAYYSGFSVDIKGIAVDTKNNMVFWTNTDGQIRCGRIGDASFTATNTLLDESTTSAREFLGIDVDGEAGKVYWCDAFNNQIRRVNFDGSDPEDLISATSPRDIELDLVNGKMYYSAGNEVLMTNLEGTDTPVGIYVGSSWPQLGLAIDLVNNKIFWIEDDEGNFHVFKADLDGTNRIDLLNIGSASLNDIECDPYNQRIYLIDSSTPTPAIISADYDGGDRTVIQSVAVTAPQYLAIDTRTMDPLNLTSATLQSNAVNVPVDANITINFDQNLDVFALNTSTVIVTGEQTGIIDGALAGGGTTTLTFDPTADFKAGEVIRVTLTADLMNTGGNTLTNSYSFQFTTATNPGPLTPPAFNERVLTSTASGTFAVFPVDLDTDGDMDAIGTASGTNGVVWFENDGSQNFTEIAITNTSLGPTGVYSSDVDSDGDMDILTSSQSDGRIIWFENDGSQNFSEHLVSSGAGTPSNVYTIDMDGDGDQDALSTSFGPTGTTNARLMWHENDGAENFSDHVIPGINGTGAYPTDVDEDGDIDIVATSEAAAFTTAFANELLWFENDGNQNFTEHIISDVSRIQVDTYAADMDGDGDVDLLLAGSLNFIGWYENDGSENFTEHEIESSESQPREVYASDIDGDGDLDVIAALELQDEVALYLNDGSGSFTRQSVTMNADLIFDVYAADMDSDGDMDILSASRSDNKIAWYENTIVNKPPEISFVFYLDENSPNGTRIGAVFGIANNEGGGPLTYSILSGNTNNAFALDPTTGIITVASESEMDFETTPAFDLTVQADDGNLGLSMVSITINLNNIVDENPLGVGDLEEQVNIYPNPAHETLTIELAEGMRNNLEVRMFTLSGSRVPLLSRVNTGFGGKVEIDLIDLDAGIYVLKLQSGDTHTTKNILIR